MINDPPNIDLWQGRYQDAVLRAIEGLQETVTEMRQRQDRLIEDVAALKAEGRIKAAIVSAATALVVALIVQWFTVGGGAQ